MQIIFALLDPASERSRRVDSGIATGACRANHMRIGVPTNSGPMAKGYVGASNQLDATQPERLPEPPRTVLATQPARH